MHACMHPYIHTYIQTYVHTYIHTCIYIIHNSKHGGFLNWVPQNSRQVRADLRSGCNAFALKIAALVDTTRREKP